MRVARQPRCGDAHKLLISYLNKQMENIARVRAEPSLPPQGDLTNEVTLFSSVVTLSAMNNSDAN